MTIKIKQRFDNAISKDKSAESITLNYVLYDDGQASITPADAYTAAAAYAKTYNTYSGLYAQSVKLDTAADAANRVYTFSVTYTPQGGLSGDDGTQATVRGVLRFSTRGHSSRIVQSKQTSSRLANTNLYTDTPDFKGLLNVQDGQAQGIDIITPCLHVDVTAQLATTRVTAQWLATYYNLTGKVNSDTLWAFPAHTLLFKGLDGSTNGSGTCSLTFSFDFQPNVTTTIAPFSQITKNGWEYVWTYTELHTDSATNTTQPIPRGLYVERVYDEASFSPFQFITVS